MSFASSFNCPTVPLWRCCSLSLWAPESLASLVRDICQPPACFIALYSIQHKNISSEMLTTQTNISLKIKAGLSPLSTAFFFFFFFTFLATPRQNHFFFFFFFQFFWVIIVVSSLHVGVTLACTRSSTDFHPTECWAVLWGFAASLEPRLKGHGTVLCVGYRPGCVGWPPSMLPPPLSFTYHQHSHWGDEALSACGLSHLVRDEFWVEYQGEQAVVKKLYDT